MAARQNDEPKDEYRPCPTRTSGPPPLIVQLITPATCLERQRRQYHKCFTCAYRGVGAAQVKPPSSIPQLPKRERAALDVSR